MSYEELPADVATVAQAGTTPYSRFPLSITPTVTSFGRSGALQPDQDAKTKSCRTLSLEKASIPINPQGRRSNLFQAPSHTASITNTIHSSVLLDLVECLTLLHSLLRALR